MLHTVQLAAAVSVKWHAVSNAPFHPSHLWLVVPDSLQHHCRLSFPVGRHHAARMAQAGVRRLTLTCREAGKEAGMQGGKE